MRTPHQHCCNNHQVYLQTHFTGFGCPLTIMTNQSTHFINDVINTLLTISSLDIQGNGQVEFTNKVFGSLLTKLVNENINDWDEQLSTILFSYPTTYKVGIGHTPFQLVYGLHHYYLYNIYYHLDLVTTEIHNLLES